LKREPNESRTWNNLGAAHEALGQVAEAYDAYQTSVKLDPARDSALANLMLLTIRSGRFDEAREWLRQAQAVPSQRLDVLVGQAVLLRSTDPVHADALMERCRGVSPEAVKQILQILSQPIELVEE